jgi:TIR domain
MGHIFISYSRKNSTFANRLYFDLKRAGLEPWLDTSDIPNESLWANVLRDKVETCEHFLLLASPESRASEYVEREIRQAETSQKPILRLWISGKSDQLGDWAKRQLVDGQSSYGESLSALCKNYHVQSPLLLVDMLQQGSHTVGAAAELLLGTEKFRLKGQEFARLPMSPSAYGMTWLTASVESRLIWPSDIGVLFHHTGAVDRARYEQALAHWHDQSPADTWLIMVEGPVDKSSERGPIYKIDTQHPHVCKVLMKEAKDVMEKFIRNSKRVGFYMNTLTGIAFEVGVDSKTVTTQRRVYQYAFVAGGDSYHMILDGWRD